MKMTFGTPCSRYTPTNCMCRFFLRRMLSWVPTPISAVTFVAVACFILKKKMTCTRNEGKACKQLI